MADDWITTNEAADLSGYHLVYLRTLIREGRIEARKFGPVWQVNRQSLMAYIKAAEQAADKRWGPKR
jgi:excisionase family DNA binding protein